MKKPFLTQPPPGFVVSARAQALSFAGYCGVIPQIVGPFSAELMCFMILFVWSRNFPEQSVSLWGIIKLQVRVVAAAD